MSEENKKLWSVMAIERIEGDIEKSIVVLGVYDSIELAQKASTKYILSKIEYVYYRYNCFKVFNDLCGDSIFIIEGDEAYGDGYTAFETIIDEKELNDTMYFD